MTSGYFRAGSKLRRLQHPAVEHDAAADIDREELDRRLEQRRDPCLSAALSVSVA